MEGEEEELEVRWWDCAGANEEAHHGDAGQAYPALQIRQVQMLFLHIKMKERYSSRAVFGEGKKHNMNKASLLHLF